MSGAETPAFSEAARFQRDLYLYLRAARAADGLALTGRGYVSRPALRSTRALFLAADGRATSDEANADLPEVEDGRLYFLRRLLERLGLLHADDTPERAAQRLIVAPTDQIAAYFARPLAERLRTCARVWVAGGWWLDASDARAAIPGVMTPAAPGIALARRRLIDSLSVMRPGETDAIPGAATQPKSGRTTRRAGLSRKTQAPVSDEETVRAALLGPLAWLGLVRLRDDKAEEYVIESACVALEPSTDAEILEAHGRVTIQPDLSILAYPPLTAPLLVALDLYADLERLDRVARYKLSRAALARSGRSDWDAGSLAERLERLTETPLPENIRVTLRDWQRQGERLHAVENATVLEVDDAVLLDALLADGAARGWIERRLSATAALLIPRHGADVRAWLLRHGELPATLRKPAPRAK